MNHKIKTLDEMKRTVAELKSAGKRVVLANGCFDMLHGGHISYLEDARRFGDMLVVAVNSDVSMHRIKGPKRPVYPQEQRLEILAALECVDYLVLFDEATCDGVLRALVPHVHAKGTDYTKETVPERETARQLGIETVIAGNAKENATRDIIELIVERYTAPDHEQQGG
jgi:rfaE bifunctional protein nucleotidyltransferase chain/domain